MLSRSIVVLSLTTAVGAAALVSPASAKQETHDYANQTLYGNPSSTAVKAPPKGYSMFFLETVGRHGARPLTSDSTEKAVLAVWNDASKKGQLTTLGKGFAKDVKTFQEASKKVGYGRLSGVGKDEWIGIGRRNAASYRSFFASVRSKGEKITTYTTDVTRTKQSADAYWQGLHGATANASLTSAAAKPAEDADLKISNGTSTAGKAIVADILARPAIKEYARTLLRGLYTEKYVASIKDPVKAALDVHKLYSTAPGLRKETTITFARYVPQATREPLSYATDAQTFFKYGPGVKGETSTFKDAEPILDDFFGQLDARIKGGKTAAVIRIAHGETTMPFAALIKAPGSEVQVPKGQRFARQVNPWRGSWAGRLSGNIEWTAYRNAAKNVLVTMRYNEVPVPFHAGCKPYTKGSYFYTVAELKRCLG